MAKRVSLQFASPDLICYDSNQKEGIMGLVWLVVHWCTCFRGGSSFVTHVCLRTPTFIAKEASYSDAYCSITVTGNWTSGRFEGRGSSIVYHAEGLVGPVLVTVTPRRLFLRSRHRCPLAAVGISWTFRCNSCQPRGGPGRSSTFGLMRPTSASYVVDLDIDSDYDGTISVRDDPIEVSAGGVVAVGLPRPVGSYRDDHSLRPPSAKIVELRLTPTVSKCWFKSGRRTRSKLVKWMTLTGMALSSTVRGLPQPGCGTSVGTSLLNGLDDGLGGLADEIAVTW